MGREEKRMRDRTVKLLTKRLQREPTEEEIEMFDVIQSYCPAMKGYIVFKVNEEQILKKLEAK